jgi:hypothetical protein
MLWSTTRATVHDRLADMIIFPNTPKSLFPDARTDVSHNDDAIIHIDVDGYRYALNPAATCFTVPLFLLRPGISPDDPFILILMDLSF